MSEAMFNKAVEIVNSLPEEGPVLPTQQEKLYFYGHYKQAKMGDVTTPKPGLFDLAGKAKWNEWNNLKGMSKEDAMSNYVTKLVELLRKAEGQEEQIKEIENA